MEERKNTIKNYENSFVKYITGKICKNNLKIIEEHETEQETKLIPIQPISDKQLKTREFEHPSRNIFHKEQAVNFTGASLSKIQISCQDVLRADELCTVKSTANEFSSEKTYDFFCTNGTSNLRSIIFPNDDAARFADQSAMNDLHNVCIFDHDVFDVTLRIIPEYYMDKTGITVGALNFNFYNSIIDSIRNMRILSEHQIVFIDTCTSDEYKEIINEYNKVIQMLNDNNLF